jgi:hypothetical protein
MARNSLVALSLSSLTSALVRQRSLAPRTMSLQGLQGRLFGSLPFSTGSSKQYENVLDFYLYGEDQPIGSTQDETKRLLAERDSSPEAKNKILAVLAQKQVNGRGSK